ncbi:MAG: serine/threonine-protein kinase [Pirellulales bacterium]
MSSSIEPTLSPEDATRVWDLLGAQVELLAQAWEQAGDPPDLAAFVPAEADAVRRMLLVELVKLDLELGWQTGRRTWRLEQYVAAWPDVAIGGLPVDLIYEEYHIRRSSGDEVDTTDFLRRFPQQATDLRRLLEIDDPELTTSLARSHRLPDLEVGDKLDDFELLAPLGQGAFAKVFLALQRSMQRMVALKVSADRGSEPQTLAQLDHPHIVRVFDQRLLPERRLRLLYMQFVSGGTLAQVVQLVRKTPPEARSGKLLVQAVDAALADRGEPPPTDSLLRRRLANLTWPQAVCWLGVRLAEALDYAHGRGVLHRDIKPANVLVSADGSPKLVDFNISFSSAVAGATPAAYFGGSLAYMSPEQLEASHPKRERTAADLDARSDVFSLAVMLWELLTGYRPYQDDRIKSAWTETLDTLSTTRQQGVSAEALARMPRDVPPGMPEALLACLSADREERPASAGQFARRLELCLQPRASNLLRVRSDVWRWLRRRPVWPLVLGGLIPNVVLSVLNILINFRALVERLEATDPELVPVFKYRVVPTVNTTLYPVGLAVLVWLAWPVISSARRRALGLSVPIAQRTALAVRSLWIPDITAWFALSLWIVSGLIIPTMLHRAAGSDSQVGLFHYAQFALSQSLCGLIAGSLSFFLLALCALRVVTPLLVDVDAFAPQLAEGLTRLSLRTWLYVGLGLVAFVVALCWLVFSGTQDKWLFGAFALVGLAGLVFSLWAARAVQSDAAALALAMRPTGGEDDTLDSFWSATR